MNTFDAVRTGFRITRRFPRIGAVETIWRTAFVILVLLFLLLGLTFFLKDATISNTEIGALRSKIPILVSLTVQRLLIRFWPQLWRMGLFIASMSSLMWFLFASLFRCGVVGMIRDAFQQESMEDFGTTPQSNFASDVRTFAGRMGAINLTYLFFTGLILVMNAAVFWGSIKLGVASGETLAPWIVTICLTLGWTILFLLWAILDVITDLVQIGLVMERRSFASAMQRAAQIFQTRFGTVIGIGLVIFVLRMILAVVLGIANMVSNVILSAVWPPLIVAGTAIVWFIQSVFMYYLYIVNLASFTCLFKSQPQEAPAHLPFTEKIIYEQ